MIDPEIYELIPPALLGSQAMPFNVPDWTLLCYVTGHTNFTGHCKTIIPEGPINAANCTFCLENAVAGVPCEARVVGLRYNSQNQGVWHRDWGSVIQNTANTIAQIGQPMTGPLSTYFQSNGYTYATVEVKGNGRLYMATMTIDWIKPDIVDWGPAIGNLVTRVTNLEQQPAGSGGSYDDSAVLARVAALEARMTALRTALA